MLVLVLVRKIMIMTPMKRTLRPVNGAEHDMLAKGLTSHCMGVSQLVCPIAKGDGCIT